MKVYLDTSSAIKLYKEESETEEVEEIVKMMLDGKIELHTSYLTLPEIIRGLSKGDITEKDLEEIESDFRNYERRGLVFIPISNEVIDESLNYIKKYKLFVADAIHLASALRHTDILITNDKQLLKESLKSALKRKITILKPSEFKSD